MLLSGQAFKLFKSGTNIVNLTNLIKLMADVTLTVLNSSGILPLKLVTNCIAIASSVII